MKKSKGIMETNIPRLKDSSSNFFVSVNVTSTMRTSGLSRQSTREIIRLSIGSLLFLGVFFIVIYTILLAFVDKKFRLTSDVERAVNYKKLKFIGKKYDSLDAVLHFEVQERKVLWNASRFFSSEVLPHCKLDSLFRIIITSAPANILRREEIRKTWCKPENFNEVAHSWHCIFLISDAQNEELKSKIKQESSINNDILLGTFIDSYRNLTFKVIQGFDWVVNHCPSSFIVKTDDDCFVNSGVIYDFLLNRNRVTSNLYAGSFVMKKEKLRVIRHKASKWSVSYRDFPHEHYPPYASGVGYILSIDSAKLFVRETKFIQPISNEDAYVGIVMSRIGIKPTVSSRFLISPSGLNVCNFLYVMVTHDVQAEKQAELMQTVLKSKSACKNFDGGHTWS